jgi:hypothetical protein
MTQHELIIEYLKEHKTITPAKMGGHIYKDNMFGSECSKRCRELRKKEILESANDGKFEVFYLKGYTGDAGVRVEVPIKKPTDYDSKIVATINAIHPWKPNFNPTNKERLL